MFLKICVAGIILSLIALFVLVLSSIVTYIFDSISLKLKKHKMKLKNRKDYLKRWFTK